MPTRTQLKADAKLAMSNRKPSVYLITLLMLVIISVLDVLALKISFPDSTLFSIIEGIYYGDMSEVVEMQSYSAGFTRWLLQLALQVMTTMVGIGFTITCLKLSRGAAVGFGELFDGFGMFFKFIWLEILMNIFVTLWTMLFIIPGIIAAYKYSMAIYIQIDHPEYSALECIRQSKEMMNGHKFEYFVLRLSFIGWDMLSAIPFVSIYVEPYIEITLANYYCALSGSTGNSGGSSYDPSFDNSNPMGE